MNYSWIKRRKFKLNVTIDNWRDVFYLLLSSFSSLGSILLKMSNESHDLSPRRHPTIFLSDILGLDKRDVTFLGTGTPRKLGGAGGKYWSSARKKKSRGGGGISRNEIFRFSEDIVFDVSKRYENELTSTINSSIDLIDLHPFAHNWTFESITLSSSSRIYLSWDFSYTLLYSIISYHRTENSYPI